MEPGLSSPRIAAGGDCPADFGAKCNTLCRKNRHLRQKGTQIEGFVGVMVAAPGCAPQRAIRPSPRARLQPALALACRPGCEAMPARLADMAKPVRSSNRRFKVVRVSRRRPTGFPTVITRKIIEAKPDDDPPWDCGLRPCFGLRVGYSD